MPSNPPGINLEYSKDEKNPKILEEYYVTFPKKMSLEQMTILVDARQEDEEDDKETLNSAQALFETWMKNKGENLEISMNSLIKSVNFLDPSKLTVDDLAELKRFSTAIQTETSKMSPQAQALFAKTIQLTTQTIKGNPNSEIKTQFVQLLKSIRYKLAYAAAVTVAGGGNKIAHIMQKYPTVSGTAVCALGVGKWIAGQLLYGYFYGTAIPDMASTQSEIMCGNSTMVGGVGGMKKYRKTIKRSPVFTIKKFKGKYSKGIKRKGKSSKRKGKSSKGKSKKY